MTSAKDPRVTSTDGHEPDAEGSAPGPIDPLTGQHESYWILTEEERAKGFVRPVREQYVHRGKRPKHPTRPLTEEEKARYGSHGYVLFEEYPKETGKLGRFWTEADLNSGCGVATRMSLPIAETYARDPKFYGATFCVHCKTHLPVEEFVWEGTDEILGS